MSDSKVNLRKIIGLEEEINRLAKQANMPRINGGKGIAWMDGYGENGKEPSQEEKEASAEKDKGNTGSKNLDQKKDASDPLQIGDDAGDMGGLKDCSTGQCINVRLHGNARAPDGWNSVCDPPKDNTYREGVYLSAEMSKRERVGDSDSFVESSIPWTDYRTPQQVVNVMASFFRMDATWTSSSGWGAIGNPGCSNVPALQYSVKSLLAWRIENASTGPSVCYPDRDGRFPHAYYSIRVVKKYCINGGEICNQPPPTDKWPKDQCSEIVAGSGGFKGACPAHDPNLPSQFSSSQGEITLCDKDGNEVKFTKTAEGYEVYQEKYRRTAVVDPNTFKVVKFK